MRLLIGLYNLGDGKIGEQVDDSLLDLEYRDKGKWHEARAEHFSLNGLKALSSWRGDVSDTESLHSKLAEIMNHDQYDLPEIAAQLKENTSGGDEAARAEANKVKIAELLKGWIRKLTAKPMFERNDIRTADEIKDKIRELANCLHRCKARTDEEEKDKETLEQTLKILDRHVKKRKDGDGLCFETDGLYLSVCLHLFLSASSMWTRLSDPNMRMEVGTIAWIALRNYVALVLYTEIKCKICKKEDIENVSKGGAQIRKFENE